jgi:hypothetical protein
MAIPQFHVAIQSPEAGLSLANNGESAIFLDSER